MRPTAHALFLYQEAEEAEEEKEALTLSNERSSTDEERTHQRADKGRRLTERALPSSWKRRP